MKSNKGLSLVELLITIAVFAIVMVEISTLMINCSSLYRNGVMEVELQVEAQQIIQQLEDLMIDANVYDGINSIYDSSINSDKKITISTNSSDISGTITSVEYSVSLDKADSADEYGSLYFTQKEDGTVVAENIPMADYVKSVSINKANFYTNDIVTLSICMSNGKYTYETSKDIFVRNMIGSKRSKRGIKANISAETAVPVLRYGRTYVEEICEEEILEFESSGLNLGDKFDYSLEWSDPTNKGSDNSTIPSSLYNIKFLEDTTETNFEGVSKKLKHYYVECRSDVMCQDIDVLSSDFPRSTDPDLTMVLYATSFKTGAKQMVCSFKICTPAVSIGLGDSNALKTSIYGYGLAFPSADTGSDFISAIGMDGFDIRYCTSIEYEGRLMHFNVPEAIKTVDKDDIGAVDALISSIGYDSTFDKVFKTETFTTNATADKIRVNNDYASVGEHTIDWMQLKPTDGSTMQSMYQGGSLGNGLMKVESVKYSADRFTNSLMLTTGRMCPDSVKGYYASIYDGYIVKAHYTLHFTGENATKKKQISFDIFYFPNSKDNEHEMGFAIKCFYQMLDQIPEPEEETT